MTYNVFGGTLNLAQLNCILINILVEIIWMVASFSVWKIMLFLAHPVNMYVE